MMRARNWMTGGLTALALAAVIASCGGTGGGGGQKGNTDEQFILNSNNSGRLVLNVSPATVDANKSDRIGLVATLSDSQGHGISGVAIAFSSDIDDITFLPGANADSTIGAAVTDASGRADIIAVAGTTPTGTGAIVGTGAIFAQTPSGFGLRAQVPITLLDVGFIDADILSVIPASLDLVEPAPGQVLFFNIVGGTPPYELKNETSSVGTAVISQHCLPGCTENGGVLCIGSPCQSDTDCNLNGSPTPAGVCVGPIKRCLASCAGTNCAGSRCAVDADCNDGSPTPANVCKDSGQSIAYIIGTGDPQSDQHAFVVEDSAATSVTVTVNVSFNCGNGVARGKDEQCDQADLRGQTCESIGQFGGRLACTTDCKLDVTNCTCGNAKKDGIEQCDAGDLGGATCDSLGFSGGTLLCGPDCTFDTSQCGGGGGGTPTPGAAATPTFTPGGGVATPTFTPSPGPTSTPGSASGLALALIANRSGDNGNGTFTNVMSATVSDSNGNPVADGTVVTFSIENPTQGAVISASSATFADPPCDVTDFEADTGSQVVNQHGVAHACLTYPGASAGATVTVHGTIGALDVPFTFGLPNKGP